MPWPNVGMCTCTHTYICISEVHARLRNSSHFSCRELVWKSVSDAISGQCTEIDKQQHSTPYDGDIYLCSSSNLPVATENAPPLRSHSPQSHITGKLDNWPLTSRIDAFGQFKIRCRWWVIRCRESNNYPPCSIHKPWLGCQILYKHHLHNWHKSLQCSDQCKRKQKILRLKDSLILQSMERA